ncbi:tetrapyrrole biosynthesis, uroporphyrinogen III synthase [Serendipita vermifera]|nr:tetrapyrrole biosynthesis, uroporphyrinogen III synthase [Serendipita vermifera]
MAASLRPTVILCKDFSSPYQDAFESRGFRPHFLQVLDTFFVNERQLKDVIYRGPSEERISGVIVTSSRAAEAWVSCVKELEEKVMNETSLSISWSSIPFFVVGNATARPFRANLLSKLLPAAEFILGAQESGTGEALAKFIVSYFERSNTAVTTSETEYNHGSVSKTSLLYLVGDKNKETIPDALEAAGLSFQKLQVYETRTIPNLQEKLIDALRQAAGSSEEEGGMNTRVVIAQSEANPPSIWLVFFSPSSSESVLSSLPPSTDSSISAKETDVKYLLEDSTQSASTPSRTSITTSVYGKRIQLKVAAIGPTTSKYLQSVLGSDVHIATSPKPDPNVLADHLLALPA